MVFALTVWLALGRSLSSCRYFTFGFSPLSTRSMRLSRWSFVRVVAYYTYTMSREGVPSRHRRVAKTPIQYTSGFPRVIYTRPVPPRVERRARSCTGWVRERTRQAALTLPQHPFPSSHFQPPPSPSYCKATPRTMSLPSVQSATSVPAVQAGAGLPIELMFRQIMDAVHKSVSASPPCVRQLMPLTTCLAATGDLRA